MVAQTTAARSDANNGLRPMARTGQTGPLGKLCNIVSVTLAHNDNTKITKQSPGTSQIHSRSCRPLMETPSACSAPTRARS